MKRQQNGLALAAVVGAVCLAILLLVIALSTATDAEDVNPAVGFPWILAGLAVLAVLVALAWRAMTRKDSDRR